MDEELLDEVELAAREAGMTVSAWMAEAARERLRLLGWRALIEEWEAEHGAFTEEELREADALLDNALTPAEILRPRKRKRTA
jgi:hypothetical protein